MLRSLSVIAAASLAAGLGYAQSHYHVTRHIRIGGEGGWDYLTADPDHQRLYVSHGTLVEVVDLTRDTVVAQISPTPGVHGIALAGDLGRGFISNGRDSSVTIFDLATLKVTGNVKVTGANPDAIAYDPVTHRVFTFNGGSANATALDAATGSVVGTIALGGRPETGVPDGRGHIYANIEDKSEMVAVDAKTLQVTARWSLAPCEGPTGLAMDREHRRLFAGCDQVMAISDPDAGKVIATVPIGRGVDGTAFDPGTQLAFSSNGADGTLTVVHEDSPTTFTVVQTAETARGARTITLDERSHTVYVSTAQFGPPPAPTPERPRPRPTVVPGTFEVLVVQP